MTRETDNQRLLALDAAIKSKRRYDQPPEAEAEQWVAAFEDREDDQGNTTQRGIPVWYPKAETEEWHRLRFGVELAEPAVRRLTPDELAELRRDMAESAAWMRAELARRKHLKG